MSSAAQSAISRSRHCPAPRSAGRISGSASPPRPAHVRARRRRGSGCSWAGPFGYAVARRLAKRAEGGTAARTPISGTGSNPGPPAAAAACVSRRAEVLRWTDWTGAARSKGDPRIPRYLYLTASGARPIPGPDIAVPDSSYRDAAGSPSSGREGIAAGPGDRAASKTMEAAYRRRFAGIPRCVPSRVRRGSPRGGMADAAGADPQPGRGSSCPRRVSVVDTAMGLGALGSAAGGILVVISIGLLAILGFRRMGRYEAMFIG